MISTKKLFYQTMIYFKRKKNSEIEFLLMFSHLSEEFINKGL